MDYQIGSLGDLISGTHTPKREIKRSTFELKTNETTKSEQNKEPITKNKLKFTKQALKADGESVGKNAQKRLRRRLNASIETELKEKETELNENDVADKDNLDKKFAEAQRRTIFVGNLPNTLKKKQLKRLFAKYGEIETVRFRNAPIADTRVPKKVAIIKKEFHPKRTNIDAFVCFVTEESAAKALEANGILVQEHHLRVDLATNENGLHDNTKAIFIGNLNFATEEEDLWNVFSDCGTVQSVRIVRDKGTSMGKGFAYVNFMNTDSVELALNLEGTEIKGRAIRVKRIQHNSNKKTKAGAHENKKIPYNLSKRDAYGNKNRQRNKGNLKRPNMEQGETQHKKVKLHNEVKKSGGFEGEKSEKKKKKIVNKGELKKKMLIKRLAPNPKTDQ